jgi:hypothetical protein
MSPLLYPQSGGKSRGDMGSLCSFLLLPQVMAPPARIRMVEPGSFKARVLDLTANNVSLNSKNT